MVKRTLIFGNGLGMALDSEHFYLPNAMADVWNNPDYLSRQEKLLISTCLGGEDIIPQTEDQLDPLHRVVAACRTLKQVSASQHMDVHWLSPEGQAFPEAVGNYIHKVATRLHLFDGRLPDDFLEPLLEFLRETKSHVATLNYDRLLYGAFIDRGLMRDYFNTTLVDGMIDRGFRPENLERMNNNDFGYYLHLHGSPLFFDHEDGLARKRQRWDLDPFSVEGSDHIVLTHVRHKRTVIGASAVLSAYWRFLNDALSESEKIIVFGYSGLDDHLNEMIAAFARSRPVLIVEWFRPEVRKSARKSFWTRVFKTQDIQYCSLENILRFSHWDY
jgi:hypothetical protein